MYLLLFIFRLNILVKFRFDLQIRRKRLARLAGSEPPASPPEPPKEVVPTDVVEEPAPMEEDIEGQKASVTRSQSSVRILKIYSSGNVLLWPRGSPRMKVPLLWP